MISVCDRDPPSRSAVIASYFEDKKPNGWPVSISDSVSEIKRRLHRPSPAEDDIRRMVAEYAVNHNLNVHFDRPVDRLAFR